MKRIILVVAVAAVAATAVVSSASAGVSSPAAAAAGYVHDTELRWWVHNSLEGATTSQGNQVKRVPKAVYVRCYTDRQAFERGLIARGESSANVRYIIAYYAGGAVINMRANTCLQARYFAAGQVTQESAGAFKTLLHEGLHRQGIHNERTTEALAIASMYEAGQLVDYNQRLQNDAAEDDATWDAAAPAGARAARLAWQQSRRYIANNYLTIWPRIGWYYNNQSWADVLDAGLADT